MKNLILTAVLAIATLSSFATVRTVSNHPNGGAQYSTLAAAYAAASTGDTLLIEGTDIYYESVGSCSAANFTKSLTLVGIGINPIKQNPKRTIIAEWTGCSPNMEITSGASGSKFYGIEFSYGLYLSSGISNIVFENCKFNADFNFNTETASGIIFRNCIFDNDNALNIEFSTNLVEADFQNCIFDGYINAPATNLTITSTFNHCLFLRNNGEQLVNLVGPTVTNCIFMNYTAAANAGTTGGTFINNIARLAATLPPVGNSGSGNLSNTNPNFITYTANAFYSKTHDYDVQSGSPAINAGNDATDIGLHGGSSEFSETGEVLIVPIVRSVNISNNTVAPGGTLNFQVQSSKPNND